MREESQRDQLSEENIRNCRLLDAERAAHEQTRAELREQTQRAADEMRKAEVMQHERDEYYAELEQTRAELEREKQLHASMRGLCDLQDQTIAAIIAHDPTADRAAARDTLHKDLATAQAHIAELEQELEQARSDSKVAAVLAAEDRAQTAERERDAALARVAAESKIREAAVVNYGKEREARQAAESALAKAHEDLAAERAMRLALQEDIRAARDLQLQQDRIDRNSDLRDMLREDRRALAAARELLESGPNKPLELWTSRDRDDAATAFIEVARLLSTTSALAPSEPETCNVCRCTQGRHVIHCANASAAEMPAPSEPAAVTFTTSSVKS